MGVSRKRIFAGFAIAAVVAATGAVMATIPAAPAAAAGGAWLVEVHQADVGLGATWYHIVDDNFSGPHRFSGSAQYGQGVNPSVAFKVNKTVEVHQTVNGVGPLAYRVKLDGWFPEHNYPNGATGLRPSIAINSSGTVVETHDDGTGRMVYTVGVVSGGEIDWAAPHTFGSGAPVAIALNDQGFVAVAYASGMGWRHRMGRLAGNDVNWNIQDGSVVGDNPSLAFLGNTIVEAYEGSNGTLMSRVGTINTAAVLWKDATLYDNGYNPSISVDGGNNAIEVHQASPGTSALWTRKGTITTSKIVWTGSFSYDNGLNPAIGG